MRQRYGSFIYAARYHIYAIRRAPDADAAAATLDAFFAMPLLIHTCRHAALFSLMLIAAAYATFSHAAFFDYAAASYARRRC